MGDYIIITSDNVKGSDDHGAYFEFMITDRSKLISVPTNSKVRGCVPRAGSMLVCLSPLSLYTLNNNRNWTLVFEKSGEG